MNAFTQEIINKRGKKSGLNFYEKASDNYKKLYIFLCKLEKEGKIKKVIRIRGEEKVKKMWIF